MKMATPANPLRDPNTLSNYNKFRTVHTSVNFEIRFDQKRLVGNVIHRLKSLTNAESKEVILDSSYLEVKSVKVNGEAAEWQLLPRFEPYGSPLKISLEQAIPLDELIEVDISVNTTEKCTALQWLNPEQTSNGKHPYMFSQCQAIHARAIFPCQDTPDVKATFDFNLSSPLPVIASGVPVKQDASPPQSSGSIYYRFEQKVPIPSYLFAIASGDIAQAQIGPRSHVAVSPDRLDECKWELEGDTERFLQTIGNIIFPYVWGEYNVLILPPSFPYGGMENPVYTFATPSIISKDRQNVDVIAHEISHSWSGNLVTNCSWEHFWLNEGWTTYLERRIQAAIHGEPYRHFSAIIGWKHLVDSVERHGDTHEFTKLVVDLKGKDPDDAFSSVPYEKGFTFIFHLENLIGKDKFDKFIPHYFTRFRGKSLDSYEFKSCILDFFASDEESHVLLNKLDWDSWFYKPGLPPKPSFDTSLVDVVYELANKWKYISQSSFSPKASDMDGLVANQIVVFLEQVLLFDNPLTPEQSRFMGQVYNFAQSQNIEVSYLYLQVGLKAGDDSIVEPTIKLLGEIGRMKFVRPLYRTLEKFNRDIAVDTFEKHKNFYHPICRGLLEKDLFGDKGA
ncbi:leukotriene A-4 hydrolase [Coccidioides immitis RS]|uniref:Leucine aminopeptidase 2 n=3 Tax=Coccidioides immitis TaxID=5501 RepID=LKHA4_COCIM|nr:leukotriene A-4 hydrolase [Coccidioides immitis RS]Q1DVD1.3 RecName: Full=Leucine aminopeptidase 2; AltName: Full=Epoxide hydrolase; AltName: Full=Leukotriene A-4 hydrolase homolog; Short=LTA-4 hydrolase [Coccidioides immitis RS]EAS30253.2 leukotriene A-4 hydrolase [Coccidioides immitis RS]KMP02562.1 leukotriene A-4 hydrolase hydrolase [Coccidioides immitis RMSCC 2394]